MGKKRVLISYGVDVDAVAGTGFYAYTQVLVYLIYFHRLAWKLWWRR
jgi:hypothetical protein